MSKYKEKQLSLYDLEKNLDKRQERIANGTQSESTAKTVHSKEELCPLCKRYSTKTCLLSSAILGHYHPNFKFSTPFLVVCPDCKAKIETLESQAKGLL